MDLHHLLLAGLPAHSALPLITEVRCEDRQVRFVPIQEVTIYSITSSACASRVEGTVRPSASAALRLMTSSNLVGCSTGSSAGFAPFNILSTKVATRRKRSTKLAP